VQGDLTGKGREKTIRRTGYLLVTNQESAKEKGEHSKPVNKECGRAIVERGFKKRGDGGSIHRKEFEAGKSWLGQKRYG